MKKLTAKQEAFVREYLIDLNATQAAIRAGYSATTAHSAGPRLLDNVDVATAIDEARNERATETRIDAAWVLKRLAAEAEADVADLYGDDGKLKPIRDWPKIWRQGLVSGIETEQLFEGHGEDRERIGTLRKIRLSDRVKRLELIGKHIGVKAFEETINVTGLDDLAGRLARAKKR